MRRIAQLVVLGGLCLCSVASVGPIASAAQKTVTAARTPDVVYVPTPPEVVKAMLETAGVTGKDLVYDLGCGDGRIVIEAAKSYGARGVGIDIDPERIKEATANAEKAGVADRVKFIQADLFETDSAAGNGRHALPPRIPQSEAPAQARQRAEAGNPRRFARLQHGAVDTRPGAERRGPPRIPVEDPAQGRCGDWRRPALISRGSGLLCTSHPRRDDAPRVSSSRAFRCGLECDGNRGSRSAE